MKMTTYCDDEIIMLYFKRDEKAIKATAEKYGALYKSIAKNILSNESDASECENDTYYRLWNSIPPARPDNLCAYGARIARNLALDRRDMAISQKRGGFDLILCELDEAVPDVSEDIAFTSEEELSHILDAFLRRESMESRVTFILRYFDGKSIKEISEKLGWHESKIKSSLFRTRKKLKKYLEREGIAL